MYPIFLLVMCIKLLWTHVSDHFKIAHIQEHVLRPHDLTMLNSAVSFVQHQIT